MFRRLSLTFRPIRFALIALSSVWSALLFGSVAFAQGDQPFADVSTFFVWIAIGGGAGVLASLIVDKVKWFAARDSTFKFAAVVVLSGVLSVVSQLAIDLIPVSVVDVLNRYGKTFIGAIAPFVFMSATHQVRRAWALVAPGAKG
jgi:hypothetical protein